jgi:hypothetical protein
MGKISMRNLMLLVGIITLFFLGLKFFFCCEPTDGWLKLKNETLPRNCYFEKRENSYLVRIKTCEILNRKVEVLCPDGSIVIFYNTHGSFDTGKIKYIF